MSGVAWPVLAVAAGEIEGGLNLGAILAGIVLLIANGFFVAAEIALLAARRTRIEEAADAGDRRAVLALRSLRELSVTFSGAQLGITMCSLGLGIIAEPAVAALFVGLLDGSSLPPGLVPVIAVTLALSIVVFLHMVLGEMAPKNLSLARAERVSLVLARPFGLFIAVFRPLILLLNGLANLLVRAVRVEPVDEHKLVHTPEELALALAESRALGTIQVQDAQVLDAALSLATIDADAAMTPRVDLDAIADDASLKELLELARDTGHTRIPVFHGDIDQVVGLVHVKEVLLLPEGDHGELTVADVLRPIHAVPESRDLEQLLRDMLDERSHAALVVNEFGGTAGMVTLEDVLEELVGEITDEFDPEEIIGEHGERRWVLTGLLRRDEVARATGLTLDEGGSETLSGWIVERLGRLAEAGDRIVTEDGWTVTVLALEGRRAGEVEIVAPPAPVAGGADGE